MDWRERVSHYASGGTGSSMKDEDSAARNIVSGLCGSGSRIHLVASRLGVPYDDATEFEIARCILDAVSGGMFHPASPNRRFIVDVRKPTRKNTCWADDGELEELCEIAKPLAGGMIAVCRVERADRPASVSYVFTATRSDPPGYLLMPSSTLCARSGGVDVWRRETKFLFRDMARSLKWEVPEVRDEG